jgi:hypothetical protein
MIILNNNTTTIVKRSTDKEKRVKNTRQSAVYCFATLSLLLISDIIRKVHPSENVMITKERFIGLPSKLVLYAQCC